jgi:hypothetical protein
MLIPTMTPVDRPLDSAAAGLGDGGSDSPLDPVSTGIEVDEVDVVDGVWVDVVEVADDVVGEATVVGDVVEEAVAVLVSDSGREEARIQK